MACLCVVTGFQLPELRAALDSPSGICIIPAEYEGCSVFPGLTAAGQKERMVNAPTLELRLCEQNANWPVWMAALRVCSDS